MRAFILLTVLAASALAYPTQESELKNEHPWELELTSDNVSKNYNFPFVTRAQWGARNPTGSSRLATPVPNVVIHHTVTNTCTTRAACISIMQSMQNQHMNTNGWADLGYNFVVGGDGSVYEGRGWNVLGAHAAGFNSVSVGIALIGNWSNNVPPRAQLDVTRALIAAGVNMGQVAWNYRLLGHRQVVATECPGIALQREIQTWPNWRTAFLGEESQ